MKHLGYIMLFVAAPCAASVHPPEVEARLASMVGDWTVEGMEDVYRETCTWYGDRSFVVCDMTDTSDDTASVSVIGYSQADGHYTYQHYSKAGSSRNEIAFPFGERGLVFTAERKGANGVSRFSSHFEPLADGRAHFRQVRSLNGGPWTESADLYYVPRSGAH